MRRSWSVPPSPLTPLALPQGSLLCMRLSLPASPLHSQRQGPGRWAQIPSSRSHPKNALSPRAPGSLWSNYCLLPAPRSNRSLRGSRPCGQYVGQRSLSFHPSNVRPSLRSPGEECVVLRFLITRAGSEHLGWAHRQGGNLGIRGAVCCRLKRCRKF